MAGIISRDSIEAILRSSDMASIVGEYTRLERRGNALWGCCPFHNEKSASFHIEPDKNFYYCFGCHAGGDIIKFVMEMEKLSYVEAVTFLAKKAGVEVVYQQGTQFHQDENRLKEIDAVKEVYNRIASTFHYLLTETEGGRKALEYIKERGLTDETIEKFKLGYSPEDRNWLKSFLRKKNYSDAFLEKTGLIKNGYPFFHGRLMFPIFDRRGETVAFGGRILSGDGPKYLNSSEMPHYKKRETLYAFNFAKNSIREKRTVILCEGYMDVIAYHQCGIDYAVAPLGTAFTDGQINIIKGFADTVLLSFDSDGAGQNATNKAILMCRQANLTVKVIRLTGAKDPAEIMIKYGAETLTNFVNSAILDNDFLLSKLMQQYPQPSPEDKTKAAYAFFPYVDSLQSDIQKDVCLEQFSQAFNLRLETVKRDFNHRDELRSRVENKGKMQGPEVPREIKMNAELRAVLAVISNLDQFKVMRDGLSADDFEDPLARELFVILEEGFGTGNISLSVILGQCGNEEVQRMITKVIASGEFSGNDVQFVRDSMKIIKRNSIERQRERLMERIRSFTPVTQEDKNQFQILLSEKMQLDKKVQEMNL